jgi:hypothetical protein
MWWFYNKVMAANGMSVVHFSPLHPWPPGFLLRLWWWRHWFYCGQIFCQLLSIGRFLCVILGLTDCLGRHPPLCNINHNI